MLKLIFLAAAFASVAAQNCIPGAEPDGEGGCRCQTGREGNPDLCCYRPNINQGCFVAGDPILTSFSGNKIGLDFPCGTMISSSQVDLNNCVVNVFASGREMSTGAIFTSQVKIQLRQLAVITLTFNFDSTPFRIHYETSASAAEDDFTMSDGETKSMNSDGIQGDLMVSFHAATSLFIVNVGGIEVNVRPSSGMQASSPGVCVMEPVNSLKPSPGSSYACSLNQNIVSSPIGEYLEYAIQPMKNYMFNTGILRDTTSPQYADMCQHYQDTITGKCEAADRYNAMKKCAFILFQPVIRRCFHEASNGNQGVMTSFLACLDTYCEGTRELCDGLKADPAFQSCAGNLNDCNTWPPFRRVNSFVAGEGDNENFGAEDDNLNQNTPSQWNPLDGILGGNEDQSNDNAGGVETFNPPGF